MYELNTFYLNKKTLNSGYIFVSNVKCAKQLKNLFDELKVGYTMYINNNVSYGFKVFRIKRRLFELTVAMKEVVKCY